MGVRFKKVHFLSPKGPLFGGPAPLQIDPGYGPGHCQLNSIHLQSRNSVTKAELATFWKIKQKIQYLENNPKIP